MVINKVYDLNDGKLKELFPKIKDCKINYEYRVSGRQSIDIIFDQEKVAVDERVSVYFLLITWHEEPVWKISFDKNTDIDSTLLKWCLDFLNRLNKEKF